MDKFLQKAYADKTSSSYKVLSGLLRINNKLVRKHLARRLKKKIVQFAKYNKINLGFHSPLRGENILIECFSSDINTAGIYFGIDSRSVYELYEANLDDNSIFLDVGANVGVHSLLARAANESVEVYSFEPSPNIFARLRRNIQKSGDKDIVINQLALADQEGEIYFDDQSDSTNIGISKISQSPTELKVKVRTIDSMFSESKRISLIKIDVEGAEPLVLSGAQRVLARDRPKIFLEFNNHQYSFDAIRDKIPYEFRIYIVEKDNIILVEDSASLGAIRRAKDILIVPLTDD